jgi:hypothetical protein
MRSQKLPEENETSEKMEAKKEGEMTAELGTLLDAADNNEDRMTSWS